MVVIEFVNGRLITIYFHVLHSVNDIKLTVFPIKVIKYTLQLELATSDYLHTLS
jgi:hypothetical protein